MRWLARADDDAIDRRDVGEVASDRQNYRVSFQGCSPALSPEPLRTRREPDGQGHGRPNSATTETSPLICPTRQNVFTG